MSDDEEAFPSDTSVEMHSIRSDLQEPDSDAPEQYTMNEVGSVSQDKSRVARRMIEATDITTGLGKRAAVRRLTVYGLNLNPWMIHQDPSHSAWPIFSLTAHTLASGLLCMLIYVVLSIIASSWWQVGGMALLLGFFLLLAWFHILRWRAATKQMKKMLQLRSRVLRDGIWMDIPSRELVPGDIIELSAGHIVPARCVVRECSEDLVVDYRSIMTDRHVVTDMSESADRGVVQIAKGDFLLAGVTVKSGEAYRVQVVETGPDVFFHHQYDGGMLTPLRRTRRKDLVYTATWSLIALVFGVFVIASAAGLLTSILSDRQLAQVLATATFLIVFTSVHNPVALVLRHARTEGARRIASPDDVSRSGAALHSLTTLELLASIKTIAVDVRGFLSSEDLSVKKLFPMKHCTASGLLTAAALATSPESQAASHPLAPRRRSPVGDMEPVNMAILEELRLHNQRRKNLKEDHYYNPLQESTENLRTPPRPPRRKKKSSSSSSSATKSGTSSLAPPAPSTSASSTKKKKWKSHSSDLSSTDEGNPSSPRSDRGSKRPRIDHRLGKQLEPPTSTSVQPSSSKPDSDTTVGRTSLLPPPPKDVVHNSTSDVIIEMEERPSVRKKRVRSRSAIKSAKIPSSSRRKSNATPYLNKKSTSGEDTFEGTASNLKSYSRLGALFPPGCTVVHLQAETSDAIKYAKESNPSKEREEKVDLKSAGEVRKPSKLDLTLDPHNDPTNPIYSTFLVARGDPRSVIRLCIERNDENVVNQVEKIVKSQTARGRSVIAVAKGVATSLHVLERGPPTELNLLGLICCEGTILPDTYEALADAAFMDLDVKMITNDAVPVGVALGKKLGIGSNIITIEDYLSNDPNTGGKGLDVNLMDGFAEVTPENKIHLALAVSSGESENSSSLVDPSQSDYNRPTPVRPLWGLSATDPSVLFEADLGIAHRSDVDVAVQSADVVLMQPGIIGLTRAIRTARQTMAVLESLAVICAVQSLRNMICLIAAWVTYGFVPIPTTSLIIIVALNLPLLLSVAQFEPGRLMQNATNPFLLRRIIFTSVTVALFEVIAAFLFGVIIWNISWRHLTKAEADTAAFLWFCLANAFMVLLCRSPSGLIYRHPWPHPIVVIVVILSQLTGCLLSAFGIGMTKIGWANVGLVWVYTFTFFSIQNLIFFWTRFIWNKHIKHKLNSQSWFMLWHARISQTTWYRGLLTG